VAIATADQRHQQEVAAARVHEYAELLAETTAAVARQIDELRLPLQILLDNHFGSLNENQEEMLGAARQAADAASLELRRLEQIANLDTGALQLRRDPVRVADLLRSLLPVLKADGDGRGVEVEMDVEPGLPRVAGDRMRLQEALELWLRHTVRHADPSHAVRIVARRDDGGIAIVAEHGATSTLGPELALARRVVEAHGGTVELGGRRSSVRLPALPTPVNAPRP
jgi:signal transduction histidine kinase